MSFQPQGTLLQENGVHVPDVGDLRQACDMIALDQASRRLEEAVKFPTCTLQG